MADQKYDFGRAGRMYVSRVYLGLDQKEMAAALNGLRLSSYQRWENGQAGIPAGVWSSVDQLLEQFDQQVEALLKKADGGPLRVRVYRGGTPVTLPVPASMWLRIVAEAMRENPKIEPVFAEDFKEGS